MQFRLSENTDIPRIMQIIYQAQNHLKEVGVDQWQNGYPNESSIDNDIKLKESYVILHENSIVGTFALSFRNETTYDKIFEGEWLSIQAYAVIHRIALDNHYKGLGLSTQIINEVKKWCIDKNIYSIKVDTHVDNGAMRTMLAKNGFNYCGIIYLLDGNKRVAYEKLLNSEN